MLESSMMLVTTGWGNLDQSRDEARKRSINSMNKILSKAEREGIVLTNEILLSTESNLVTNLVNLKEIMNNFDSDNMAICVDTVPMCAGTQNLKAHLKLLADYNYEGYIIFETTDDRYLFKPGKAFEKNWQLLKLTYRVISAIV